MGLRDKSYDCQVAEISINIYTNKLKLPVGLLVFYLAPVNKITCAFFIIKGGGLNEKEGFIIVCVNGSIVN